MDRTVTIAGREFTLRYDMIRRRMAERKAKAGLWEALTDGTIESQIAVIWAGISKVKVKKGGEVVPDLTTEDVFDLLEKHREEGEYAPIVAQCAWAIFEARLFGKEVDHTTLRQIMGEDPAIAEDDEEDGEEGKAPPTTVPAES